MGQKGRIVLPVAIREALGVEEDDELIAVVEDRQVILMTRAEALRQLRGMCDNGGVSVVDELIAERHAEAARDDADTEAWLAQREGRAAG